MSLALGLKTHYSVYKTKRAFGSPKDVVRIASENGYIVQGIADVQNCVGHREFATCCKEFGVQPIYGARIKLGGNWFTAFAKKEHGIAPLYELVTKALSESPIDGSLISKLVLIIDGNARGKALPGGCYFELSFNTSILAAS